MPNSPRFGIYPTVLRNAAVLLLFASLLATVVQAAPVPTHATTLSSPDLVVGTEHNCDVGRCVPSGRAPKLTAACIECHPQAPIVHQPELAAREEVEMVVLARRRSIAAKIRAAFHHIGHAIKHAFQKVGAGIKHVAQKVGQGIKHAAQKVGHFIKTTGAKIVKVGLKIISTVQKVAAKVVGWLPGIGKPLGKIMEGESEGLNKVSDAIHVHIGGKLGQAMHRMDKAQKVVGYIP